MKYHHKIATLVLSAALIGMPALALAHEDGNASMPMECHHHDLSKAQMELLHKTMQKTHEQNKAVHEELHALYKKQHDVLMAKTFDKNTYLSNQQQIEEKHAQLEKNRVEAFASIADKFTPQQREHLAHMFGHHHHGHHGGWRHGHEHGAWHQGDKPANPPVPDQAPADQGDATPAAQ